MQPASFPQKNRQMKACQNNKYIWYYYYKDFRPALCRFDVLYKINWVSNLIHNSRIWPSNLLWNFLEILAEFDEYIRTVVILRTFSRFISFFLSFFLYFSTFHSTGFSVGKAEAWFCKNSPSSLLPDSSLSQWELGRPAKFNWDMTLDKSSPASDLTARPARLKLS